MADVIITHTTKEWTQLQVTLYICRPEDFPEGITVLEQKTTTIPMLVSDGTGTNIKSMSDADLTTLLDNSKPARYDTTLKTFPPDAPIMLYTNKKWHSIIQAAKEERDRYLIQIDPMDITF